MTIDRIQAVPGIFRPAFAGRDVYSTVVTSDRPRMVFVAGQLARDANGKVVGVGDIRAQMRQVGENIRLALAAVGGTLDDVVQTTTFITSMALLREAADIRHEYFGRSLPTSTTVQVGALAGPDFLVEITATAMLP